MKFICIWIYFHLIFSMAFLLSICFLMCIGHRLQIYIHLMIPVCNFGLFIRKEVSKHSKLIISSLHYKHTIELKNMSKYQWLINKEKKQIR